MVEISDANQNIEKKNEKKKAVRSYLQAAFLFPDQKDRPKAFYLAIVLLKEMNDPRWKNLETTLKKRYPDSEYSKKLPALSK